MSQTDLAVADRNPDASRKQLTEGRAAESKLDRWTAMEAYRRALQSDPMNHEAAFRLAFLLDLVGEEDEALKLYEQVCSHSPVPVEAMINLAVMYEDQGELSKAERLLRIVADKYPNHARARLFLKDVATASHHYYQEKTSQIHSKYSSLLETPVADFDLSVRARNALKKMNARTIGDLLRMSEQELLAYRSFGETTLAEIKAMLSQKGLKVGQALVQAQNVTREQVYQQLRETAGEQAVDGLSRPVDELNLSVRSRKALELLNIQTVGDLVSHTEAELLGIKNFGATSLTEIKLKLTELGLSLRQLEA